MAAFLGSLASQLSVDFEFLSLLKLNAEQGFPLPRLAPTPVHRRASAKMHRTAQVSLSSKKDRRKLEVQVPLRDAGWVMPVCPDLTLAGKARLNAKLVTWLPQ